MKKILSLLLILLLSVTLISGCFKKTDKPAASNDKTSTDLAEASDDSDETATEDDATDEDETDYNSTDSSSGTDATTAASYEETSTGSKSSTGSKTTSKTDSSTAASYVETSTGSKTSTGSSTGSKTNTGSTDTGTGASYEEETPTPTTPKPTTPTTPTPTPTTPVDTTTAASIDIQDAGVLAKSLSKDGKWIVCIIKNITTTNALVMEGDLLKTGSTTLQRKLALYSQDADHNITAEFTLTAPKLTIKSPNARIQNGTFIGDIYVETTDFQLVGTKVIGNVYFANEAAKAGFKMDAKSSITPKAVTTQSVDGATAASLNVESAPVLQKSIGIEGKWIIATTKDITTDKALVMEGNINKTGTVIPQRKLALYAQDANKVVTAEYKLTAPKLTVKSVTSRIQNGTFVGDIYVESTSFQLVGTKVVGNVYFATDAAKTGFKMDGASSVSGSKEYLYR